MRAHTVSFAKELGVVGLINVQFAIKNGEVYVLEVNPRGSRTVPFVSKAIGVSLAAIAARVMLGETLEALGFTEEIIPSYVAVKEAVFPFTKFREFDPILGPEMRSTGRSDGNLDVIRQRLRQGSARRRQQAAGQRVRFF
jgi:carbamoyl-phosphate synthase large subunit